MGDAASNVVSKTNVPAFVGVSYHLTSGVGEEFLVVVEPNRSKSQTNIHIFKNGITIFNYINVLPTYLPTYLPASSPTKEPLE